ncbi:hypothetical protein B0H11DRAFT_2215613 [Mycena galericulata]|nr:hypothetical protein B0H11DRAFT_2215613 [Mycena galericulata]
MSILARNARLSALQRLANLDDINDAAHVLSVVVQAFEGTPGPPLNLLYTLIKPCSELLAAEPGLYSMLKLAHASKEYEDVRNSELLRRPRMLEPAQEFLDSLRQPLIDFVTNSATLFSWMPEPLPEDPEMLAHITELKIRTWERKPVRPRIILTDLGSFSDDPTLLKRIENIFVRGKQTFLVNTSGSGKTRLLFEGLLREWGLYFTFNSFNTEPGSRELLIALTDGVPTDKYFVPNLPPPSSSDFSATLDMNHRRASCYFGEALLARLLIFQMFLEIIRDLGRTEEQKYLWLLLQLRVKVEPHGDIFDNLTMLLRQNDDSYTRDNVADTLAQIRELLGSDLHLFVVVDEGQVASRALPEAFHSDKLRRPALREILQVWEEHLGDTASFVVGGTDMPEEMINDPDYAAVSRWTSDTGAFDDPTGHERYLRRFLPPSFLETESGKAFIPRAWRWLHGRHRYTSAFVADLLAYNFQNPHTRLNDYVQSLSGYLPTDDQTLVAAESRPTVLPTYFQLLQLEPTEYDKLDSHPKTKAIVQDVLFHYLLTDSHPPPFGPDKREAVSIDYGRFTDGDMQKVVIDEAIVLAGMARQMNQPPSPSDSPKMPHNYLSALQRQPPHSAKTFAMCLAFYFSRALTLCPMLSDLFTFASPIPVWANEAAELVGLHANEEGDIRYSVISGSDGIGPLATSADDLNEIVSWMEHKHHTPFCLPSLTNPDLLFVMKLANGSFLWVVVQATPSASGGGDLLACLHEKELFRDEARDPDLTAHKRAIELLNTSPTGSKSAVPTVLRVVASFEDQIVLTKRTTKAAPRASLSMDSFRQVSATVSPSEIVESMVASVLGKRNGIREAGEGKGKGHADKRQKSLPAGGNERESTHEVGKRKAKSATQPSTRVTRSMTSLAAGKRKGKASS